MKRIWRCIQSLLGMLNVVFFVTILYFLAWKGFRPTAEIDSIQVVTIVLACLAILLTSMTIFLAVAAILGYGAIKEEARLKATEVAGQVAKSIADAEVSRALSRVGHQAGPTEDYGEAASTSNGTPS